MSEAPPLGVYVHWPYCARICPYCDFNVVRDRGRNAAQEQLFEVILADIRAHAALSGDRSLVSIFLGGGTPSLMPVEWASEIVHVARAAWPSHGEVEITLEANPADADRLGAFAEAGVNRLSLGVQAFNDATLSFLGRDHDAAGARRALRVASEAFPRVSIDMIYALPGQDAADWSRELDEAIAAGCEHISAYQLSIEPGAAFDRAVRRGAMTPLADEPAAALYEFTQQRLEAAGFDAYEISNHALGASAWSRHNLVYWRGEDYVGVGPGAHGRLTLDAHRGATLSPKRVGDYITRVREWGIGAEFEPLDGREAALERLLMGLRTVEGAALRDLEPLGIAPQRIADLSDFVTVAEARLKATSRGRLVLDRVAAELAA